MTFSLTGQIVTKWTNRPIQGATVTLAGGIASTDINGNFSLTGLPEGRHVIRVVHKDYRSYTVSQSFGSGPYMMDRVELTPFVRTL